MENFKIVNWAVVLYGVSSVGLESGYILLFRGGWSISLGGLVCNITLAVIMIFVGAAFFSETLSPMQFGGIACCLLGLIFISKSDIDKSEEALENKN